MELSPSVGASLEAVVEQNNINLPEGSLMVPIAIDMRGAVPAGSISFSATEKPEVGIIYHSTDGKSSLYNFCVEPFKLGRDRDGRPNGIVKERGSLHHMQMKTFVCPAGCGTTIDRDRDEARHSIDAGTFYCEKCFLSTKAASPDKQGVKYAFESAGSIVPKGDDDLRGQLADIAAEAPDPTPDMLMGFYAVCKMGMAPMKGWRPSTPLEHEAADKLARAAKGPKEIRPMGELLKLKGPIPGLIEIIGLCRPLAIGWVPEHMLWIDRDKMAYKRMYPRVMVRRHRWNDAEQRKDSLV